MEISILRPSMGQDLLHSTTTWEDRSWDLSKYDGLELDIEKSDENQYTFVLNDEMN
jgi:hypothetical protein